jgi:ABC-type polysaccharide transport system, permease component
MTIRKTAKKEWEYYILIFPAIIFFILFNYMPMYGLIISFKDMQPGLTISESPWVGLKWFSEFFNSPYFWRSLKNTLILALNILVIEFPLPIVFALILNEIKGIRLKKIMQSISSFPHFISTVIVVAILFNFLGVENGLVNNFIKSFGKEPINFFNSEGWYMPLYIFTDLWKELGWSSIIYIATLANIDPCLYEAAKIDGASRYRQIIHVSLPGLYSTIMILLILQIGNMFNIGFEKVILMYNPSIYGVADIISTFVYRSGILGGRYSYSAAVGFFNQILNFIILVIANKTTRRISGEGLW